MAGRGRLSSIDLLPEEAQDDIVWACQQLHMRQRTQTDILFELNDRLEAKGLEGISRSAFNRKAMRLAAAANRMAEAREMFRGLSSQFTAENVDENTIALGEFLKTLVLELIDEGSGQRTPKEAMELGRAYLAAIQGQKISADRRRKLQEEMAIRATEAVEKVAKARGMSAETVEAIKSQILGVRAPIPAEPSTPTTAP